MRWGAALGVLAAVGHLVEAALIGVEVVEWPGGSRPLVGTAVVAFAGLVGLLAVPRRSGPRRVAAPVTVAGAVSVMVDLGAPSVALRMVPGVLLLACGALLAIADARAARAPVGDGLGRWLAWAALTVHVLLLPPLLTLGLVAPWWAVLLLLVVWTVGLGLARRARSRDSVFVVLVPPAFVAVAGGVLALGGQLLGWGP